MDFEALFTNPVFTGLAGTAISAIGMIGMRAITARSEERKASAQITADREKFEQQIAKDREMFALERQAELEAFEREHEAKRAERNSDNAAADKADRVVVVDACDSLLFQVCHLCQFHWLGMDNKNEEEKGKYSKAKKQYDIDEVDLLNAEHNRRLQFVFYLFQMVSGARLANTARRERTPSPAHKAFLDKWERVNEALCNLGSYPGAPLLRRDQIEVIAELMLKKCDVYDQVRPLNWREFAAECQNTDSDLRILAETASTQLMILFDEAKQIFVKKRVQMRLCALGLYMIEIVRIDNGSKGTYKQEEELWKYLRRIARERIDTGHEDEVNKWYVFKKGDVIEEADKVKPNQSLVKRTEERQAAAAAKSATAQDERSAPRRSVRAPAHQAKNGPSKTLWRRIFG